MARITMPRISLDSPIAQAGASAAALVVLAIGALLTKGWWLPPLQDSLASLSDGQPVEEQEAEDHEDSDVLHLTDQTVSSMKIDVQPLKRSDRDRKIQIPGQVVEIPGITHQDISTPSTGTLQRIFVREGQVVKPGDPLFEVSLVHEEAITLQLALLDALAELEVVGAEIERLAALERERPGGIYLRDLRKQRYDQARLKHTVASRQQALLLLGLDEAEIAQLVARHKELDPDDPEHDDETRPLLDRISIAAPAAAEGAETGSILVVEHLTVKPGQHVETGTLLCRLGDYQQLHIQGRAFERDLNVVRNAMRQGWRASAKLEQRVDSTTVTDLEILYVDPTIDEKSRSARFFIAMENVQQAPRSMGGRTYADWQFRPGQQIDIRIPVEKFAGRLVVPIDAIARDGPKQYVFQVSGNTFVRQEVTIDYRDEEFAVISEADEILEGKSIAMSGAYQLQLALLNRSRGGGGGGHHGHSH